MNIFDVNGNVIYESKLDSLKETVEDAVINNVSLYGANLHGANLSGVDLSGAYLSYTDLSCTNLSGTDLSGADLSGAYLNGVYLNGANLFSANLSGADLSGTDLSSAYLNDVYLSGTNLIGANLSCTYLSRTDLSGAYLYGAYISHIKHDNNTIGLSYSCPEEGSFIGYKKVEGLIVKLRITEDALRSSATTKKCRCSKAEVLEIQKLSGEKSNVKTVCSNYDDTFVYEVRKTVKVKDFDTDRWNECSTGIHFFMDRDDAVNY